MSPRRHFPFAQPSQAMPRFVTAAALAIVVAASHAIPSLATDPATTIVNAEQVLAELIAIPAHRIPSRLLNDAQAIAVIPRVIKIGFVAGVRRGNGVILVRDAEGAWSLPRFIRLTGGSVGWQAGVQGTDVVLVFRTRRSVDNLMRGRFTIGVDAAAAAGPVGRNAAAATDASLQAEILSYSRSRGLFLGASVDGSVIELDAAANTAFYGSPNPETPQIIPPSAISLQSFVVELAGGAQPATPVAAAVEAAPANPVVTPIRSEAMRRSLVAEAQQLFPLLSPEWQSFLALPASVGDPNARPSPAEFAAVLDRYQQVAVDPKFAELAQRPEFQITMEILRDYVAALQPPVPALQLPAPPTASDPRR